MASRLISPGDKGFVITLAWHIWCCPVKQMWPDGPDGPNCCWPVASWAGGGIWQAGVGQDPEREGSNKGRKGRNGGNRSEGKRVAEKPPEQNGRPVVMRENSSSRFLSSNVKPIQTSLLAIIICIATAMFHRSRLIDSRLHPQSRPVQRQLASKGKE